MNKKSQPVVDWQTLKPIYYEYQNINLRIFNIKSNYFTSFSLVLCELIHQPLMP
jgi:hypothetical protein